MAELLGTISRLDRRLLSLAVFVLTLLIAWIAGVLSSRWARGRSQRAGAASGSELRIGRVRSGLVALLLFVGAYLSIEVAPLPPRLEGIAAGVTFVGGALVMAWLLTHLVTLLLTTSVAHVSGEDRARLEREYVPLTSKVTTLAVTLIFVVVVAKHFGQDVTSLIAALGVGSLAIGLAAQQTLGNMIAGFVLLVDRPFRPGDRIRLATGESGEVREVGVRSTRILLADHNMLIVPNTELANSRVVNYAYPSLATRAEVKVAVAYGADLERASQLLTGIAAEDERVLKQPAPLVRVTSLGRDGIELSLGFDVATHAEVLSVEDQLRRKLLKKFAAAEIPLPSAVSDVRVVPGR